MTSFIKPFYKFQIVLYVIVTVCLLDTILYQSLHFVAVSLIVSLIVLMILFLTNSLNNSVYVCSFLILFISFYSFTIAPYSETTELGAFFIVGPLIFFAIVMKLAGDISEKSLLNFGTVDKLLLVIVFLSLIASNTIFNPDEITEPQGMLKMIAVGGSLILFVNYLPSYLSRRSDVLMGLLKAISFVGILSGIFGLLTIIYPELKPGNEYPGLAISFYKHPNATSSIYNFSIPVTVWLLLYRKQEISKLEAFILYIGTGISFLALVLTLSRIGIATVMISVMILIFKYSKKLFLLLCLGGIGLFFVLMSGIFTSKGAMTLIGRVGLLETAIQMLSSTDRVLFGYGGISTKVVFENTKFSLGVLDPNNSPHNIVLYSILLYGVCFTVPSFILFIRYSFLSVICFVKNRYSDVLLISFSICTGLFLKNMAEDLLFFQEFFMWYLFLIFFGMMVIEINKNRNKEFKDPLAA